MNVTVISLLASVLAGLIVAEFTDVAPYLARRIVRWSAYRWSPDQEVAAGYAEEWSAVISDQPGRLGKLVTAVGFACGASSREILRRGDEILRRVMLGSRYVRRLRTLVGMRRRKAVVPFQSVALESSLEEWLQRSLEVHGKPPGQPTMVEAKMSRIFIFRYDRARGLRCPLLPDQGEGGFQSD